VTELEQQLTARVEALEAQNRLLQQKLEALIRLHFGKKSEKLDSAQLELLLKEEDGAKKPEESAGDALIPVDEDSSKTTRKKNHRERKPRLPEDLPVEEETLIPDAVKACPEAWRRIGEEVSEQLDYQPGRFLKKRLVRPKFVKRSWKDQGQSPMIAALPKRLVEGGLPTAGLLAQVVVSKYCDHLPLYRQQQIYHQRHGVDLPRQTLARWIEQSAFHLQIVARAIHQELLESEYLQIDETPLKYLAPGHGQTKQGYLWLVKVPGKQGGVTYHWHTGRSHQCLKEMVPSDYQGTIQSDGYRAYQTFLKQHPAPLKSAACWAHVRRKFHDALQGGDHLGRTSWIIHQIQQLYRIERDLRESRAGPALRKAVRQHQSQPIIGRIHRALNRFQKSRKHLPQSLLGQAITYTLGQWSGLGIYVDNGLVEIDNNQVENAVRPTAIGKKNFLFIGAAEAGWRSAVIYTIIESARHHGLEPYAYLKELFERLPEISNQDVPSLTPRAISMAKRRQAS
jgi:transposase